MFRHVHIYIWSYVILSNTLATRDTPDGTLIVHITRTSLILNKGVTLGHFQSSGNMPVVKEKIIKNLANRNAN